MAGVCRDTAAPGRTTRWRRPLQPEPATPSCRWSTSPRRRRIPWPVVPAPASAAAVASSPAGFSAAATCPERLWARCGTGGGAARARSSGRTRRRSVGTGAASAPCVGRSRALGACRRCGTARRTRCTCSAGPRARHARVGAAGSWWWTRRRTVHTGVPPSSGVAATHAQRHVCKQLNYWW